MEKGETVKSKIVKILWVDACADGKTWNSPDDLLGLCNITTVGILVKKTKEYVCIAHSRAEDGYWCGMFYIPKGCCKDIQYLTEV